MVEVEKIINQDKKLFMKVELELEAIYRNEILFLCDKEQKKELLLSIFRMKMMIEAFIKKQAETIDLLHI